MLLPGVCSVVSWVFVFHSNTQGTTCSLFLGYLNEILLMCILEAFSIRVKNSSLTIISFRNKYMEYGALCRECLCYKNVLFSLYFRCFRRAQSSTYLSHTQHFHPSFLVTHSFCILLISLHTTLPTYLLRDNLFLSKHNSHGR